MQIHSTALSNLLSVKTVQTSLSQFLSGQLLSANVVSRKSPDTFILEINNQRVEAKTNFDRPLQAGQKLNLIVEKQSAPTTLRILNNEPSLVLHENKQQLLRLVLPKQTGMEKMPQLFTLFSSKLKQINTTLPAPFENQLKKLIQNLPAKENINNPVELKTTIKDSGLLLEAKLLTETLKKTEHQAQDTKQHHIQPQTKPLPNTILKDLKANLLQLSDTVAKSKKESNKTEASFIKQPNTPPFMALAKNVASNKNKGLESLVRLVESNTKLDIEKISKQIESSIARIEVNQTKAVVTNDTQLPVWSIETPVKDTPDLDLLKLDIHPDNETKNEQKKDKTWTVNIKLDFEHIGTVSAKISMFDQEITASLWSENKLLNSLIDKNINLLDKQIEKAGLTINKITCLDSCPIEQQERSHDKLVNIKV